MKATTLESTIQDRLPRPFETTGRDVTLTELSEADLRPVVCGGYHLNCFGK